MLDLLAGRHRIEWESAPRGIDALSARWRGVSTALAKPLTFMNLSGPAVVALLQFFKIELPDLLVIDQVREPVAADDEAIGRLDLEAHEVHLHLVLEPHRPGDDVLEPAVACLVRADRAGLELLVHE